MIASLIGTAFLGAFLVLLVVACVKLRQAVRDISDVNDDEDEI